MVRRIEKGSAQLKRYKVSVVDSGVEIGRASIIVVPARRSTIYCDTPIPGVPLTTRQPTETYKYRVSRYHTHLSHILRPILAYLIHKYTKIYDRLFNQ